MKAFLRRLICAIVGHDLRFSEYWGAECQRCGKTGHYYDSFCPDAD